jgi:hypothetical protein
MAPGISELLTLSTYNTGKKLADNISKGNAALMKMEERGNIRTFDGGVTIREPLDYGQNSNVQFFSGAEQFSVGWWPGDQRYGRAAFFAFAFPMPEQFADAELGPRQAHWDNGLGEFVLDWEDIRSEPDPHGLALEFARSAFEHSCAVCEWDPVLASSGQGVPPPLR